MTDTIERTPVPVVAVDRWDRKDIDGALDQVPPFAQATDALAERSPVGGDLGRDLFALLHKPAPRLRDDIPVSHALNRAVIDQVREAPRVGELRSYTVGDPTAAGLGVAVIHDTVTELQHKLADVQEKADEAQAARQRAEEALADALEGASVEDRADLPDEVEQVVAEAEAEADQLADAAGDAIDAAMPQIGRAARAAVSEAAEAAGDEQGQARGWGTDPGTLSRMDPTSRLRLAKRLKNERTREIAAMFGRMRSLAWAKTEQRYDRLPEEVFDICLAADLVHLLPIELAFIDDPDLADDWLRRYVDAQLACYELRALVKEGLGGIIYLEDGSQSMHGDREVFAKGFGFSLLGIAKDEARAFHAFLFGGPGEYKGFHFPRPADFVTERMLDYAEARYANAGTDLVAPLDAAIALLEAEHAETGSVKGSIVIASDGEVDLPPAVLATYQAAKDRLQFHTYGIAIGCPPQRALLKVCDSITTVERLIDGTDIADIFEAVSTP